MSAWISPTDLQNYIGADKVSLDEATMLAAAATQAVQAYIDRDLSLYQGTSDWYDSNGTNFILLDRWPIRSLTSLSVSGLVVYALAPPAVQRGWTIDRSNSRKLIFQGFDRIPRGVQNINVVGLVAGYDLDQPVGSSTGLPYEVWLALRLTAAAIFNAGAADPNLMSENTAGVFSGSYDVTGVGAVPRGARTLLAGEMRVAP
jgi:hypothetical protein